MDCLYFNNGWLTAVAPVPEPAALAAILGAVALGFAIRRRK
ncbi:MAG: PEP-CTERM sorting domain-containing protein [Opitutales bacterium]|nr:PEP-CTERM sorting domain-containing protein [Opitutales bacterium]